MLHVDMFTDGYNTSPSHAPSGGPPLVITTKCKLKSPSTSSHESTSDLGSMGPDLEPDQEGVSLTASPANATRGRSPRSSVCDSLGSKTQSDQSEREAEEDDKSAKHVSFEGKFHDAVAMVTEALMTRLLAAQKTDNMGL